MKKTPHKDRPTLAQFADVVSQSQEDCVQSKCETKIEEIPVREVLIEPQVREVLKDVLNTLQN
jgi:hypothetical protein